MEDFDLKYDDIEPIREEPIRYKKPSREPDEVALDSSEEETNKIQIWFEEDHCLVLVWRKLHVVNIHENNVYSSVVDHNGLIGNTYRRDVSTIGGELKRVVDLYLNHLILR